MTIGSFEQKAKIEQEAAGREVWPKRFRNHKGDIASANDAREASQLAGRGFTELHDYTHQEFPKMLHADGKAPVIVQDEAEQAAQLAAGYSLSPNQAEKEDAAPDQAATETPAASQSENAEDKSADKPADAAAEQSGANPVQAEKTADTAVDKTADIADAPKPSE